MSNGWFIVALILVVCYCLAEIYWFLIREPKTYIGPHGEKVTKSKHTETTDLYAWKIFQLIPNNYSNLVDQLEIIASTEGLQRSYQAASNAARKLRESQETYFLGGYVHSNSRYSVLGENHYQDKQIVPRGKMGASGPIVTDDRRITMSGFHCFKNLSQCVGEIKHHDFGGQRTTVYLVGKVRIWGTVVEAEDGYQAEYLEIVELYSTAHSLFRPYQSRLSRTAFDTALGWPFGEIKFVNRSGKIQESEADILMKEIEESLNAGSIQDEKGEI